MDNKIAAQLYEMLSLSVFNIKSLPQEPSGKVQFLGYADFQIFVGGLPFLRLNGNSIKRVGDQIYFDPKVEQGKGAKAEVMFPLWAPSSAEARAVLTRLLQDNPDIQAMAEAAQPKAIQKHNPFVEGK